MKVLFFKVLSVCIMVLSIAWALVWRDGARYPAPAMTFAFGCGLALAAF